jgi:adenine-specific DNA-methyltransferase
MQQNVLKDLEALLQQDDRLVVDGQLLKNKVIELALKLDAPLLKLLLSSPAISKHFFEEVDGIKVFDKIKFQQFVNNKNFLPDSYTSFKNKIGLTADHTYLTDNKEVVLAWPYKDCVLEGGQTKEEAKRNEIFYNETLAPDQIDYLLSPKTLGKFKRYDKNGEHPAESISKTDNLLIKGNNLLSLHTLHEVFAGAVDLIYIDPPYNPDSPNNTFCYNNNFNRSTWLTFMRNRLEIARSLLKPQGVMIVAIDKQEFFYLGVLIEEVFRNHETHCITIVHNPRGVQGTNFSYTHEYAIFVLPKGQKVIGDRVIPESEIDWSNLRNWGGQSERTDAKNCFYPVIVKNDEIIGFGDVMPNDESPSTQTVKNGDCYHIYPIDTKGIERKWRYARQSVEGVAHLLRAKKTKSGYEIEIGKDFGMYRTVWVDNRYDANDYGTGIVKTLMPDCKFDFPKSLWNVYDCLHAVVADKKDALILDFFAGSGTTGHAVMELNKADGGSRQFILCEQMHYVEPVTAKRVQKVIEGIGSGSFVYAEIKQVGGNFAEQIENAQTAADLQSIWETMQEKAFLSYKVNPSTINQEAKTFEALSIEDQKKFLMEVLDKNMLYVPLSEIDDETYGISEGDKKLNAQFFGKE